MKTVYLLRHAKSDWGNGGLNDHARPLNARGKAAAALIGAYLQKKSYAPSLILCSTARRTVETLDLVRPYLKDKNQIRYEDTLYLAPWEKMLERINWVEGEFSSVMLLAHNPGTEQLALNLAGRGKTPAERARRAVLEDKYPTCALTVLKFSVSAWKEIKVGQGMLADFVRPKDLDGVESD